MIDWNQYPNFSKHEFDCKHTGINRMRPEFLDILQQIRNTYAKRMIVSSGYRDKTHPSESRKQTPGVHFYGCGADIAVRGQDALDLIIVAYGYGIRRIGISQNKDKGHFVHLDTGDQNGLGFPPSMWTY